jgi:hypothetical protein
MSIRRFVVAFSIGFILLVASAAPALAVDYNIGVTTGQYVTYGNFVGIGEGLEVFNETEWLRIEVMEVSGKEVTLLTTGQLKNGTPVPENGNMSVWNVATGALDGIPSVEGPIIAANLNEGDPIPPPNTYIVNSTEDRIYLGDISRSVNIISSEIHSSNYNKTLELVYDRISGILLEAQSETVQIQPAPAIFKYSYSVIETNIFGGETHQSQLQDTGISVEGLIIVVAVAVIVVFIAVTLFNKRLK